MKIKIARWGNSLAVRLPKAVSEGIEVGQTVEISRKGSRVEIESAEPKAAQIPRYQLEDLVAEMKRIGLENAPPSVDWGPDRGSEIIDDEYSRGEITLDDLMKK